MMHRLFACYSLLISSLLLGCGPSHPPTIYVNGIVKLDGEPVEGAAVLFSPAEGRPAMATTDASGKFELKTFEPGDGAVPGDHKVSITLKEVSGVTADPDGLSGEIAPEGMQTKWIVPERYASLETSDLTVTVERGISLPVELNLTSE